MMRRSSFKLREPPVLTLQARGSRTKLTYRVKPLDRPMLPQNREEEPEQISVITRNLQPIQQMQIQVRANRCVNQGCTCSHSAGVAPG
ncbi:MAG: hypothetical protein JO125_07615 [Chloroflexi bacterium]|nr:hypothetical protein [Chloroflexota bacterium]